MGDTTLNTASDGTTYVERNERQTKQRTWENVNVILDVSPKIYKSEGERDPLTLHDTCSFTCVTLFVLVWLLYVCFSSLVLVPGLQSFNFH